MGEYNPGSAPGEAEPPFNRIHMALVKEGKIVEFSARMIPWYAFSRGPLEKKSPIGERRQRPPEKLHPLLRKWIAERHADETDSFMINFRDDLILPRFPEPPEDQSPDSTDYREAMRRSEELVQQIKSRRAENYDKLKRELSESYKVEVRETFWLINAALVQMALGSVVDLAQREDVQYIEPRYSGEEPPQVGDPLPDDANPYDDVQDGRALLASDPFFNLGLIGGRIGLLDTGVRFTHTLFNQLNFGFRGDCVNGGPNCDAGDGFNPCDDCWNHGTSSAAIIMADTSHLPDPNQRDAFRGVTGIILDSYKVYPTSFGNEKCSGTLDVQAAVWGFETAVARLDKVIVAEIQSDASDLGAISTAADKAFDTGAAVIAANGNAGPNPYTVNAPASAHKVIGVGEIDVVDTPSLILYQSRGPAPDGRHKPDIQAPTRTETASNASDTALRIHIGTSGATPYAAGAAALLRNWLQRQLLVNSNPPLPPGQVPAIDPGHVYAQLILAGQQPFPFDDIHGAGPLRLTADGGIAWGKVLISQDMTIDISLTVSAESPVALDAALWWPETAAQPSSTTPEIHNDIDLFLVGPNETEAPPGRSNDDDSVFERAHVDGPIRAGVWKLRIQGCDVPGVTQTVYWAARGPFDGFIGDA